jgi:hypothetical protein
MSSDRVTITRQQLRDAIEAGIAAAVGTPGFTDENRSALRRAGDRMATVSVGLYSRIGGERCPVAEAYPQTWVDLPWKERFALDFDRAMIPARGSVLHVTDNDDSTEGGA